MTTPEKLLRGCFPDLRPASVARLERGWDSTVLVVDDEWIFRVPRRDEVKGWIRMEAALLPVLAPLLPVDVPHFEFVCSEHMVVGYRMIRGLTVAEAGPSEAGLERFARGIGAFLSALHRFPVDVARTLGVRGGGGRAWKARLSAEWDEMRARVLPLLGDEERRAARAMFEAFLGDLNNFRFTPALLHADLGPDHILCSADGEVRGVIDWSDARIGDPALDLGWLGHGLGPRFARALLACYAGAGHGLLERARFYHRVGPWHEVVYGLDTGRKELVASGLAGVRERLQG